MQTTFPLHTERSVPPDKQKGTKTYERASWQHYYVLHVQYVTRAAKNNVLSLDISLLPSPWHVCCLDLYV